MSIIDADIDRFRILCRHLPAGILDDARGVMFFAHIFLLFCINISIDTNGFLFYFIRRICLSIVQADINSILPFMRHAPKAVFYYCWSIESDCCL